MSTLSRREFIHTGSGAAAVMGIGLTAPTIARNEQKQFSGRVLNVGFIGVGGKGRQLMEFTQTRLREKKDVNIAAVCDVYDKRKKRAQELAPGATLYHEYEKLLKHPGLDCVVIATPDHWHAQMAIEAMEAGKDVYLEKPMTQTIEEAREIVKIQERTQRIVQLGGSGPTSSGILKARKLIADDWIGKVVWVQGGRYRNSEEGEWNYQIDEDAEKQIDWQRWLGPAPKRPYDADRYFRWRKYWDYGSGLIGDLFYHELCPLVLMSNSEFPVRVCGSGGKFFDVNRETPDTFMMIADYPNGCKIVINGSMANSYPMPQIVRGHKGTLIVEGENIAIYPESIFMDEYAAVVHEKKTTLDKILIPIREGTKQRHPGHGEWLPTPQNEIVEPKVPSLHDNFFDCVHSRQEPLYPARLGYMVQIGVTLAIKSYRENKVYCFDPILEKVM